MFKKFLEENLGPTFDPKLIQSVNTYWPKPQRPSDQNVKRIVAHMPKE